MSSLGLRVVLPQAALAWSCTCTGKQRAKNGASEGSGRESKTFRKGKALYLYVFCSREYTHSTCHTGQWKPRRWRYVVCDDGELGSAVLSVCSIESSSVLDEQCTFHWFGVCVVGPLLFVKLTY